jgi:hypothetical protein
MRLATARRLIGRFLSPIPRRVDPLAPRLRLLFKDPLKPFRSRLAPLSERRLARS